MKMFPKGKGYGTIRLICLMLLIIGMEQQTDSRKWILTAKVKKIIIHFLW